jgi:hypothetical protein
MFLKNVGLFFVLVLASIAFLSENVAAARFPGMLQYGRRCLVSRAGRIAGMTCDGSAYLECTGSGVCSCIAVMTYNNETEMCEPI